MTRIRLSHCDAPARHKAIVLSDPCQNNMCLRPEHLTLAVSASAFPINEKSPMDLSTGQLLPDLIQHFIIL